VQSGYVPDYFSHSKDAVNPMDIADSFTPAGWYTQGADALYNDLPTDIEQGNWMGGANDLLMGLPLGIKATQLGRTYIPQTYKINPWAFKPNEGMMYRGLGKEGFEDAIQSGVFRPKQYNYAPGRSLAEKVTTPKQFSSTFYAPAEKFGVVENYGPNYLAEVPFEGNQFVRRYGRKDWSWSTPRQIPIEEGRILQKDWLRGYKPVEVPTQLPGSPNVQQAGFSNPLAIADRIIPRPPSPVLLLGMEDSWNYWSPLNYIPGYGKKLIAAESSYPNIIAFRKFGNSLDDVVKSQSLRPRGTGIGSKQIMGEGNWAEPGKVNENYPGEFAAEMDPQNPGSNIKLEYWPKRAGVVGTTKEGNVAIPLTDEGLQFHRRLPFSSRYIPINKQKLINNQFQLATQLPHVQSLVEKYGLYAGLALVSGYMMGGKEQALKNLETVNKYSIDPVINWTKKQWNEFDKLINPSVEQKKAGGSTRKSDKKLVNYSQNPNFVKTQSTSWLDKYQ